MKLSAAVITYDEEENIQRYLDAISDIADEIIVVDSLSKDRTKEFCLRNSKVKFFEKKFEGYGQQKNFALEKCSGEWVLFLDTDEIPDETGKKSILKVIHSPQAEFCVYSLRFNNFIGTTKICHGGWENVYRERLFRRNTATYSSDKIHEFLQTDHKVGILDGRINHYTYKDMPHYLEKMKKYSDMMAEKMYERGKKVSKLKVVVNPAFMFLKTFFFKLGFLDGLAGYYVAKTMSHYTFMKYRKLLRLKKQEIRLKDQ